MKSKLSLLLFLGVLLIAVILSFSSCNTGSVNPNDKNSDNIIIKFSTPGLGKNDDGYLEGSGILVLKDGNMESYDLTMKSTSEDENTSELSYYGLRYKITRTETRSANGLYAGIAECVEEYQNFELDSIDSDVPDFDEGTADYEKTKIKFNWGENGISSRYYYNWNSESNGFESNPYYIEKYEYYDNGKLKDIRYSSDEEGGSSGTYFFDAEWYKTYDSTFNNYPLEIWDFYANSDTDESIPDNYNYESNPNNYSNYTIVYTYTPDSNGRIGIIEEIDSGDKSKTIITYDSSGNVSSYKIYLWNSDNNAYENTPYMQIDFTVPSGLSFTLDNMFFVPWKSIILIGL